MLNPSKYVSATLVLLFFHPTDVLPQNSICIENYFGTIEVTPDIILDGAGQNIDTIEFWKAPDITESLMFVTAKDNSLVEVWMYPFNIDDEQTPLTHSAFGSGAYVNGVKVDQEANLLFISTGSSVNSVSVFSLPDLQFITEFNSGNGISYGTEPNLTLLKLTDGEKRLYVSAFNIVYIHNVTDTASSDFGKYISSFPAFMEIETLQADNYYQIIIIPDENGQTGLYAYYPDGTPYPSAGSNNFGSGVFQADAEGILLDNCSATGDGFLVVSDQIIQPQTEFEFFDRQTWIHFGTIKVTSVNRTDGIASFPYPSTEYPLGLFAAVDNDDRTVLVNWDKIFSAIERNGGLPVELSSFVAVVDDGNVVLKWITQTEVDNYGFEIERAVAKWNWINIGFVEGHGNSNSPKEYNFVDRNVNSEKYFYRLKQIDTDGSFTYSEVVEVYLNLPDKFLLNQNYPNPFNPMTTMEFGIPKEVKVILKIYDALGFEVETIVNEKLKPGYYKYHWNGSNYASGVYFYRIVADKFVSTKKLILLR